MIWEYDEKIYLIRGFPWSMEMMQEYCMVALDVFRNFAYPKIRNEQTGWVSLTATERLEAAEAYAKKYP